MSEQMRRGVRDRDPRQVRLGSREKGKRRITIIQNNRMMQINLSKHQSISSTHGRCQHCTYLAIVGESRRKKSRLLICAELLPQAQKRRAQRRTHAPRARRAESHVK
jgi:hypothetical protein